MENSIQVLNTEIEDNILTVNGLQVMIDSDLAILYGITTGNLNKAVSRNIEKFPNDFMFKLKREEYSSLFQNGISKRGGRQTLPRVFTEHGILMLSSVLKSDVATKVNIQIMRAFIEMRKIIHSNDKLFQRMELIEKRQLGYELKTDIKIDNILNAIEDKNEQPTQGVFYNGQIFEAYAFVSNLIENAKNRIVVIDNYIDISVLTLLSKNQKADVSIYTKSIDRQLKLDIKKYNSQYKPLNTKITNDFHDRFLVIDDELYHIGASLKDLGKKVFGFSKMDIGVLKSYNL